MYILCSIPRGIPSAIPLECHAQTCLLKSKKRSSKTVVYYCIVNVHLHPKTTKKSPKTFLLDSFSCEKAGSTWDYIHVKHYVEAAASHYNNNYIELLSHTVGENTETRSITGWNEDRHVDWPGVLGRLALGLSSWHSPLGDSPPGEMNGDTGSGTLAATCWEVGRKGGREGGGEGEGEKERVVALKRKTL